MVQTIIYRQEAAARKRDEYTKVLPSWQPHIKKKKKKTKRKDYNMASQSNGSPVRISQQKGLWNRGGGTRWSPRSLPTQTILGFYDLCYAGVYWYATVLGYFDHCCLPVNYRWKNVLVKTIYACPKCHTLPQCSDAQWAIEISDSNLQTVSYVHACALSSPALSCVTNSCEFSGGLGSWVS